MRVSPDWLRNTWPAGLLAAGMGLFMILLASGMVETKPVSARRALFNDPREWQLAAFGLIFACAGLSLMIPKRAEVLGRFNAMVLVMAILAAGAGTIWFANGGSRRQKGGSMNAFLDAVGAWFQSWGMHPVLGAFILGAVIAFAFAYRRSPQARVGADPPAPTGSRPMVESATLKVENTSLSMTLNGKPVAIPPEAVEQIRAGNKIEAIKVLRHASGLGLMEAKQVVEMLEASQAVRGGQR